MAAKENLISETVGNFIRTKDRILFVLHYQADEFL